MNQKSKSAVDNPKQNNRANRLSNKIKTGKGKLTKKEMIAKRKEGAKRKLLDELRGKSI